ncbi:MAG: hypothetical protein Q9187_004706 [Circinaria calcarea]
MALRVMSGIRVPVISQIVSLGIKKGAGDMSPHVRKAAALAIPKCYRLSPSTLPQLLEYLSILLGDKQYYVVGSAVTAFLEVCPERIDLIHKHYRALVRKLVDMDEWGQLATLNLLTIYSRKCFPRRTAQATKSQTKGFYKDEASEHGEDATCEEIQVLDPDLVLLLKACKPLLHSRNSAVVVAVVRCFLYLGTPDHLDSAVGPLIALLRSPRDIQQIALHNVVSLCLLRPELFVRYTSHFFIRATDPPYIWRLKMEILTLIFPHCESLHKGLILSELEHFSKASDSDLVRESVQAIGRCAQNDGRASSRCLNLLLKQISSSDGNLVAESLTVIRHLIQQDPSSHTKTVIRLAKNLDSVTNPYARANIIWLVGEFSGVDDEDNIAPDVLRILAKGFAEESEPVKLQIVLLAAKVYVHHLNRTRSATESGGKGYPVENVDTTFTPEVEENGFREEPVPQSDLASKPEHPIAILWEYVLLLARYDTSYDLRDRTRFYKVLLADPASTQLASLVLLAPKPVPHTPSPSAGRKDLLLGSSSLIVGEEAGLTRLSGYESLPEWVKAGEEPDPKLRDETGTKAVYGEKRNVPAGELLDKALKEKDGIRPANGVEPSIKGKSFEDWLAEGESESGESEESEESEDMSEDDEEGESEEEDSEEESDSDTAQEGDKLVE